MTSVVSDSIYHPRLLQEFGIVPSELLASIAKVVDFIPREQPEMKYRGHSLKRDKFFLIRSEINAEGEPLTFYKYSYPGFQYASLLHYRAFSTIPGFDALVTRLEQRLGCTFNHAIGTRYSKPDDEIGYHADKMLDITPGTPIVSISFLDVREFHLRPLKSTNPATVIQVLLDGDVFELGSITNETMEHSVPPVAREQVLKKIAASEKARGVKGENPSVPELCGMPTKRGPPCRNKQGSCPYHK